MKAIRLVDLFAFTLAVVVTSGRACRAASPQIAAPERLEFASIEVSEHGEVAAPSALRVVRVAWNAAGGLNVRVGLNPGHTHPGSVVALAWEVLEASDTSFSGCLSAIGEWRSSDMPANIRTRTITLNGLQRGKRYRVVLLSGGAYVPGNGATYTEAPL